MFYTRSRSYTQGFGLIEVIIATAIVSSSFYALAAAAQIAFRVISENMTRTQAEFLAEEGIEVARVLRDSGWDASIAPTLQGTVYYPEFNATTSTWALVEDNPGLIEGLFDRELIFDDVYRDDTSQDIVSATSSGAVLDPDTKLITSRVRWGGSGESVDAEYIGGTTDGDLGNFPSDNSGNGDVAQSFTTSDNSSIAVDTVKLFLKRVSDPSDIYLEIREGSTVGSVRATSGMVDSSTISADELIWVQFTFSSSVSLDPETEYFLRLRSDPDSTVAFSGSSGTVHWGYLQTGPSPYVLGSAWRYVGRLSNPDDEGQELTQYDFSFQVLSSESGSAVEVKTYLADLFDN